MLNVFVEIHHFTEAATGGVLQKKCSEKFYIIHRKTPVSESLCGPSRLQFYQKETPTLTFSCEYCEHLIPASRDHVITTYPGLLGSNFNPSN